MAVLTKTKIDTTPEKIEEIEGMLLEFNQPEVPLVEAFAPGVYLREVFMRKGLMVIGHEHKTEHFNIVLTGRAMVMMNGTANLIQAPCTFISKPGVRKVLFIEEDMIWQTIHPTEETDKDKLEEMLITKSETFVRHQLEDVKKLKLLVNERAIKNE